MVFELIVAIGLDGDQVWLAGESLHELQLCATRRDFKLVHMQTRWIFHLTETGTWDGAVVIAKPL